jgi:hypothetical protein
MSAYAVTWRDGSGDIKSGSLELGETGFRLEAGSYRSGRRSVLRVLYQDIVHVEMAPRGSRLGHRPTIALEGAKRSLYLAPSGLGLAREVLGFLQGLGLS